jgi:hypothetical protein
VRLIAIDPGKAGLGWAAFEGGRLIETGLIANGSLSEAFRVLKEVCLKHRPGDAVIEIPQVYQQRLQKGDPNDLITVAVIAGIAAAAFLPYGIEPQLVRPHKWKGSRPKAVDNQYTLSLLDEDEKSKLVKVSGKQHNVLDAVGIGLWRVGRR